MHHCFLLESLAGACSGVLQCLMTPLCHNKSEVTPVRVSSVFEGLHLYCGSLKSCGLVVFVSKKIVSKPMLAWIWGR